MLAIDEHIGMSMNGPPATLATRFLRTVERFGDRPALVVKSETLTYRELGDKAMALAATLQRKAGSVDPPLTAVYAVRSVTAFTGVLGALLSGKGYVPINPDFPASYSQSIIQRTGCRAVILDGFAMPHLGELLKDFEQPLVMIVPHQADVSILRKLWPMHTFIGTNELAATEQWQAPVREADDAAYIMFTSGSTGIPKGVTVSHRNVNHFIDVVTGDYEVDEHDRFLHLAEISFDLCLLDMWIAWEVGACLYCPSREQRFDLSGYLRGNRITVSVSVPSTATLLKDVGALTPGLFPDLRHIWFCGEALLASTVLALCEAAPNATIVNFYGPTELTCACTAYRWDRHSSVNECVDGVVPIGWVFPGMNALVVDHEMREVGCGEVGELLVAGPQLTQGYWNNPGRTAAAYVVPPEMHEMYYRTGDLIRVPGTGSQ